VQVRRLVALLKLVSAALLELESLDDLPILATTAVTSSSPTHRLIVGQQAATEPTQHSLPTTDARCLKKVSQLEIRL
jgi:hypothetical protein